MPLIDLPPGVAALRDRWQTATQADEALVSDTLALLNALLTTTDHQPALNALTNRGTTLEEQLTATQQQVQNGRDRIATLTDELEANEAAVTQLRTELTQARTIAEALARNPPAAVQNPRTDKIPDPERFDGTRTKLRPFVTQLRLKAATYTDDQAKLRLAISCLTGEALDQVQPYILDDRINLNTLADLLTILDTAFGNPNRVAEAEAKLATIQQGTRDFSSYYAEFQRYAAEVNWDEPSRMAALKRGLAYRLKNDLVTVLNVPTNFAAFATLCNQFDMRRRALQGEPSTRPIAPKPTPRTTTTPAGTTTTTVTTTPTPSTQSGTHAGPMDLSANRRRLSPEERARRLAEGRCYRCGGLGHMARDCPLGQPRTMRAAETITTPAPAPVLEEERFQVPPSG